MTREEILAMEVGEELDVLIAERVMGWQRPKDPALKISGWLTFFHPSTDWSAAGQVLEKVIERYFFRIDGSPLDKTWTVQISPKRDVKVLGIKDAAIVTDVIPWIAWGKTAPEAICKAALLMKEGLYGG